MRVSFLDMFNRCGDIRSRRIHDLPLLNLARCKALSDNEPALPCHSLPSGEEVRW